VWPGFFMRRPTLPPPPVRPVTSSREELEDLLPDGWIEKHPEHQLVHREREAQQVKQRRRG
jgi:hypothetical protein